MIPIPGFLSGSYDAQISALSAQRSMNLIPEYVTAGKSQTIGAFVMTPGLRTLGSAGIGPHRAAFAQDGRSWVISGSGFYEITASWAVTLIGLVIDDSNPACICSNGSGGLQLLIVSGGSGYTFDLATGAFAQVTDPDFPDAVMGLFFEGYFVVLERSAPRIHWSTLEDGAAWTPIDVAQKSLTSDDLVSIAVDERVLWLLGSKRSEPWYNSGDTTNPLQPVPNVVTENGGGAAFVPVMVAGSVGWLASNERGARSFVRTSNYNTSPVSTPAVEWRWSQYSTVADARAWAYDAHGHAFTVITFPTAGATWVYDAATNLWHERGYFSNGAYSAHLARTHMYVFETHVVGSRVDGTFYALEDSAPDDAGVEKRWMRQLPAFMGERTRMIHDAVELQAQVGVGTTTGQGSDPLVMLQWSDDQANTWSNEHTAKLGAKGNYAVRPRWTQLGQDRGLGRVYRVMGTDPAITGLVDLWWMGRKARN